MGDHAKVDGGSVEKLREGNVVCYYLLVGEI